MPVVTDNFKVYNIAQTVFVGENEVYVRFLITLDVGEFAGVLFSFVNDIVNWVDFAHGAHICEICFSIVVEGGVTIQQVSPSTSEIVQITWPAVEITPKKGY